MSYYTIAKRYPEVYLSKWMTIEQCEDLVSFWDQPNELSQLTVEEQQEHDKAYIEWTIKRLTSLL
jgi:hypothetical protein